jgi:hypothetical protein
LYGALLSWDGQPTGEQRAYVDVLTRELAGLQADFDKLCATDVPKAGLTVPADAPVEPTGGGPAGKPGDPDGGGERDYRPWR